MRLEAWALPLTVLLLTTGCIGAGSDDEPIDAASTIDAPVEVVPGIPSAEELAARSVDAPAAWRVGEWWTFQVDAPLTGDEYEATVVVAGARGDELLLGMPADEFDDAAIVVHIPPTGPFTMGELSWYFHSHDFPMLKFPATPGKSWSFPWVGGEQTTVEVIEVRDGKAVMEGIHPTAHLSYTYDAEMGFFSEFSWDNVVSWTITDHGFDFQGEVIVPDDPYLAIFHGRVAGVVDPISGLQPGAPIEMVEVEDRDSMSLGFILGQFGLPGAGVYRAGATAPDGTAYSDQHVSVDRPTVLRAVHVKDPGGTWQLDYEALGPGVAVVEAVAYNALSFELGGA